MIIVVLASLINIQLKLRRLTFIKIIKNQLMHLDV